MIYRSQAEKDQDISDLRGACDIVRADLRNLERSVTYAAEGRRSIAEIKLESREADLRILQNEIRDMMATPVTPA